MSEVMIEVEARTLVVLAIYRRMCSRGREKIELNDLICECVEMRKNDIVCRYPIVVSKLKYVEEDDCWELLDKILNGRD